MDWQNKITQLGGSVGAVFAYILNISLSHVFEIAFFAFIGAAVGEGVKELVKLIKKKQA